MENRNDPLVRVGSSLGGETIMPLSQAMLKAGTPMQVPVAKPPIPHYVADDDVAAAEWHRIVEVLHEANAITRLDLAVLASYCVNYALWSKLVVEVSEKGVTTSSPKTGAEYVAPWFSAMNQAYASMTAAATQLGLTPKARAAVRTTLSRAADQERKVEAANKAANTALQQAPEASRWAQLN